MNQLLFVFLLTLLSCQISSAIAKPEGTDCEECTKHFDEVIEGGALKHLPPQIVSLPGFCNKCTLSGLQTMKRVKGDQVCVAKTPSGDLERHVVVEVTNLTASCDCDLAKMLNPILVIESYTTLKNPSIPCTLKRLDKVFNILIGNLNPGIIPEIVECMLNFVNVLLKSGATGQYTINNVWRKVQLGFNLVTNKDGGNARIEKAQYISAEPNNFEEFCEGPDAVVDYCSKCSNKKYIKKILMELEILARPCTIEVEAEKSSSYKHAFTELACKVLKI